MCTRDHIQNVRVVALHAAPGGQSRLAGQSLRASHQLLAMPSASLSLWTAGLSAVCTGTSAQTLSLREKRQRKQHRQTVLSANVCTRWDVSSWIDPLQATREDSCAPVGLWPLLCLPWSPSASRELRNAGATSKRPFAESTAAFTSRSSDSQSRPAPVSLDASIHKCK
eukprot:SAG31_NODE_8485_length_1442_cov_1.869695_2_plen_168_part_00